MKTFRLVFCFFFVGVLSSCLELKEKILINEDKSCVYYVSFDLRKMIGKSKQMGSGNGENKELEKKDSTIYLKDLIQNSDSLTAAEKELYKDGYINIKLDEANEQMKIAMTCPFRSINNLKEIKENFMKVLDKLKAFEKLTGKQKEAVAEESDSEMASKVMSPGSVDNAVFTAEPGKITNTFFNTEDYKKEIKSDSLMVAMQTLSAIMGEMTYKTTITTPVPIKNYAGNNAMLSDNKKTISFKNTLTEMMEHPEKLSYKVEY